MALPDEAVQKRTAYQASKLRNQLDMGVPTPIGLVYVGTRDTLQIWQNHQVLACDYEVQEQVLSILIYDPNYPRRNDVFIVCRPDGAGGLLSEQRIGARRKKHVRAFFRMPYSPVRPPAALTPDI